jgi:2,3-bisphosphoglycerate-dependent phosphoglycerate mutase
MSRVARLILMRHGESEWNRDNRFTGLANVDLTHHGVAQVQAAARALEGAGIRADYAFSSTLRRCVRSLEILLGDAATPAVLDARFNERNYGGLTGRSKADAEILYGESAVSRWRRQYEAVPPPRSSETVFAISPSVDLSFFKAAAEDAESLKQTVERVLEVWKDSVVPALRAHPCVLIVGHGNGLRALLKHLDDLSDEEIVTAEVANAVPIVYDLNASLRPVGKRTIEGLAGLRSEIL